MTIKFLGVDTGGTFTDFVCIGSGGLSVHKVLSTPEEPQRAILQGIKDMDLIEELSEGSLIIVHGTTVATNATLEGKGVKTVYIANKGLKDVLVIGRQTRNELYNLTPSERVSHFDSELLFEVSARVDASGNEISDFNKGELNQLKAKVDAVMPDSIAINLLFSFLSPGHEEQLEQLFTNDYFVSRSSSILPEIREYERGITTWLNAWIGPIIQRYMNSLTDDLSPSSLSIMQSSGLTIDARLAADRAVNLLLSGPVGGLAAAQHIGRSLDRRRLITFDMGGTSTDVSLIEQRFKLTNNGHVAGYPVGIPMADIHTIGAGGGSIAFVDEGGLLQVGPESAGASPGPACYGQGGTFATVTDANLILGRLGPDPTLADGLQLDLQAARTALQPIARTLESTIEEIADGIIGLANEHMSQALRVISVQRGHDPRQFTLVSFGGAGGLHLCDLAESLEMTSAIVPVHAGVLSALGMLTTNPGREMVRTHQSLISEVDDALLEEGFGQIESEALNELSRENVERTTQLRSLDLRYLGQTYTINVPYEGNLAESEKLFHDEHQIQYGHQLDLSVELLNYRLHIEAEREDLMLPDWDSSGALSEPEASNHGITFKEKRIVRRSALKVGEKFEGPALVIENHATTYVKAGWKVTVDQLGNLLLQS